MQKVDRKILSMDMDRLVVRDSVLQRKFDTEQMSDWVNWLAPWEVISHLTFSWECSLDSGRRVFERFMGRHLGRLSYFYALEENPSRDGFHVHSLWADAGSVFRKEAWSAWFTRYGRARIEPVRSHQDVSGYCAKYVCKERAWWNLKLQWHRIEAMHRRPFKLESPAARDTRLPVPQKEFPFAPEVFNLASDAPAGVEQECGPARQVEDPQQGCLWVSVGGGCWENRGDHGV